MSSQRSWQGVDLHCYRRSRCLLILVLLALPLSATTYYVDNCVTVGSDSNNGTSTSTPWLTIAHVNAQSFNPGDSVLFESTCTWREQLTVPSSGSSRTPITFGSYGTGAAPIISGANLLTSWPTSGSYYYASVSTQPYQVFRDGVRLTLAAFVGGLTTGQWFWDSVHSYIWLYDNPSGHVIEASQRPYAIYALAKSNVTFSNLNPVKGNTYDSYFNGGTGNIATGINAQQSFVDGIRFDGVTSGVVTLSTASGNNDNGIEFYESPAMLISYNTVFNNAQGSDLYTSGIHGGVDSSGQSTNAVIQYNLVYSNGVGQSSYQGAGIWIDTIGTALTIEYNLVYNNNWNGIRAEADSSFAVMYNITYGNAQSGVAVGSTSLAWSAGAVYGNTSYDDATGFSVYGPETSGGCTNSALTNNIAVGWTSHALAVSGGCENASPYGSGNTYTYNALGVAASDFIEWGASTYHSTYSAWETATGNCGTTGCSHSIHTAPTFTNAAGNNFTLASGSSAIDAGINLGSTYQMGFAPSSSGPASVSTLNQNSYGSGWEIGAFVFVQPISPAPPTSLSVTVR